MVRQDKGFYVMAKAIVSPGQSAKRTTMMIPPAKPKGEKKKVVRIDTQYIPPSPVKLPIPNSREWDTMVERIKRMYPLSKQELLKLERLAWRQHSRQRVASVPAIKRDDTLSPKARGDWSQRKGERNSGWE